MDSINLARRCALALVVALALGLSLVSAGDNGEISAQQEPPALAGTPWRVMAYNDNGTAVAVLPDTLLTALFGDDGLASGDTGCNRYSASYSIDGSTITIGPIITTLRACLSDAAAAQEQAFLTALGASTEYAITGDQLTLTDAAGTAQLVLVQQSLSLSGAPWQVVAYNNQKDAVVSVLTGSELTALFDDDGSVSGDTGCNRYMATYSIDGPTIAFGPIATTRRACSSDDLATQEALFLAALGASSRYELAGDELTLRDADGAAQVILVRPVDGRLVEQ
jgi:heat shock protein HslJ